MSFRFVVWVVWADCYVKESIASAVMGLFGGIEAGFDPGWLLLAFFI